MKNVLSVNINSNFFHKYYICNLTIDELSTSTKRLYFIDAVRAFAILMMLQGHFIDTLLDVSYRDSSNIIFKTWEYFRGNTAPTFFTISGLIFSYLLLKANEVGKEPKRARKGLLRGVFLIGVGYLLRFPIYYFFTGHFNHSCLAVDVLHCIGLSLILIVVVYRLTFKKTFLFSVVMFLIGVAIFLTEPLYRYLELDNIPVGIANYFSKSNGSVFTMVPWFGYVALGAFISTLFYKYLKYPRFKPVIVISFFVMGYLLAFQSSFLLIELYDVTQIQLIKDSANYNYLFSRLGDVFLIFGLFYMLENYIKQPLVLKIGQKTLSVYIIHFIILYGSFTGFGLYQLLGKTLSPWQVVFGALLFLITVCFIAFYYTKVNQFFYKYFRKLITKVVK